jgi:hypothetical protein
MKYEKYLKQIAENAVTSLFWCGEFARQAKEDNYGKTVFSMIGYIEHCITHIYWQARKEEWMKQALSVPRKFVEESRRTTALAVLNEWNKNKLEETK